MLSFKEFLLEEQKPRLVGVEWINKDGVRYSAREDGMVDCKVSDWDRSIKSEISNRKIVHIYLVADENNEVKAYGKYSAMKVLGIGTPHRDSEATFNRKADKLMLELKAKQAKIKGEIEEVISRKTDSARDLYFRAFKCVEAGNPHGYTWANNISLVKKGNMYSFAFYDTNRDKYTREEIESTLKAEGWTIIKRSELKSYAKI